MASSYSLHGRILPKLLFDFPESKTLDEIDKFATAPSVMVIDTKSPASRRKRKSVEGKPTERKYVEENLENNENSKNKIKFESNDPQPVVTVTRPSPGLSDQSHDLVENSIHETSSQISWKPYADKNPSDLNSWQKFRLRTFDLVSNRLFEFTITVFIFLNTIFLSIEYHGMDPFLKKGLASMNHVSLKRF